MTLKLLIISSYMDTWNSVRPEAEIFIGMAKLGVDITLMTQGCAEYIPRFKQNGINVIDFHPDKKFQWSAIKRIRYEIKNGNYNAVYLFNNKAIVNGLFASIGLNVKMVSYRGQTGNVSRFDPSCYLTTLNPRLDGIICVANAIRDDLRKRTFLPKENIKTIYKGHDLSWYQESPTDLSQFDIPKDSFVFGCVANARPRKGLSVLLSATHHLPEKSNIHILLVGNGMDSEEIKNQINSSHLSKRIHIAGFRTDAPALIAACNASILPSIKREGLPKTVIEAMAYEVAPIVSNTGGSAELIIDGESGIVVPPNDAVALAQAMISMWKNPGKTKEMGIKAKARINDKFHTDISSIKTKKYFENIISNKK